MQSFPRIHLVLGLAFVLAAAAFAQTSGDFTIIALPDTQHYSRTYPQIFNQQTQWIVNNAAATGLRRESPGDFDRPGAEASMPALPCPAGSSAIPRRRQNHIM